VPQTWPQKQTSLRTRRERRGLTREQLAVQAGLASSTLYLAERTGVLSEAIAAKVAPILGCEAADLFKPMTVFTVLDATKAARKAGCRFGDGGGGDRVVVTAGLLDLVDQDDADKAERMLGMVVRMILDGPKNKRERIAEGIDGVLVVGPRQKQDALIWGKRFVLVRLESALVIMGRMEWVLNNAAKSVDEIEFQILEPGWPKGFAS